MEVFGGFLWFQIYIILGTLCFGMINYCILIYTFNPKKPILLSTLRLRGNLLQLSGDKLWIYFNVLVQHSAYVEDFWVLNL